MFEQRYNGFIRKRNKCRRAFFVNTIMVLVGAGTGPWRGTQALKVPFSQNAASQQLTSYYNSAQQAPPNPILNQDPLLAFKKLEPGAGGLKKRGRCLRKTYVS